ncbi:uncharacterized protein LOC123545417 [Mercenaria mercenaria]|uniref:uncharacterized protein LOC123545417 n=1 Tax=Mercenaria mercenaria TaxID=6596 RepID=UPI00234F53EE|nr:uncharacterized protein LOC123545417 [Mercenaria mercenaria]
MIYVNRTLTLYIYFSIPINLREKEKLPMKKCPEAAMAKRRSGSVVMEYLKDKKKRHDTRSTRKTGLFSKALEYATLTGDPIELIIRDEYFSSKEAGLEVVDGVPQKPPMEQIVQTGETSPLAEQPGCSNRLLSPQAIRRRTVTEPISTADATIQCSLFMDIPDILGNDKHCRVCGAPYDQDSRSQQKLWIGCETDECTYWLHAKCLLGDSKVLTPKFVSKLPFRCPLHRK